MKVRNQILRALLLVAFLVPSAGVASTLTGVSATPSPAKPNQTVTITATKSGSENCGYRIKTGDGNQVLGPFGFPDASKSISHAYPNQGTYTVTVEGATHGTKPKCQGSATTSITITTGGGTLKPELLGQAGKLQIGKQKDLTTKLTEICQKIDCAKLLGPRIEKIFGFPKPGGILAVIGKNYGTATGEVSLRYKTWTGQSKTLNLDFVEWTPTMAGVRIPASLTGFVDQSAELVVTTKAGAKSQPFAFQLLAMRDYVVIPSSDVKVVKCDTDSNGWKCNGQGGTGDWFVSGQQGASIWGWHQNSWGAIGDDSGTDKYEINLKNGWRFASSSFSKYGSSSGEWVGAPSPGMPSGGTTWKPSVQWKVTPNDIVDYHIWVEAEGPLGVPYK